MRNSKYGTTVRKYSNLHVQYENNNYNRHFRPKMWPPSIGQSIFRLKWPFLVRFGLNLGLNNLKFGQKAISDRSDRPNRPDRPDRPDQLSGQILSCLDLN